MVHFNVKVTLGWLWNWGFLRLTDLQWCQSTLPIRFGGLGIRRISDICLPAFLSSIHGVENLVSLLLNSKDNEVIIHHYDEALAVWDVENENERPTFPQFQKNWDNINIKRIIANDLIFNSSRDLARFKALQCRESGSWLHAIPSPNIGTLLDNTSFQVCIGLRLGCNLCTPHVCIANAMRKLTKLVVQKAVVDFPDRLKLILLSTGLWLLFMLIQL
jgi:hypothetical protein